jgi:hypothetical protein
MKYLRKFNEENEYSNMSLSEAGVPYKIPNTVINNIKDIFVELQDDNYDVRVQNSVFGDSRVPGKVTININKGNDQNFIMSDVYDCIDRTDNYLDSEKFLKENGYKEMYVHVIYNSPFIAISLNKLLTKEVDWEWSKIKNVLLYGYEIGEDQNLTEGLEEYDLKNAEIKNIIITIKNNFNYSKYGYNIKPYYGSSIKKGPY